jgi:hypothetical protein
MASKSISRKKRPRLQKSETIDEPLTIGFLSEKLGNKINLKKKTEQSDQEPPSQFFITYGWAILVILAAIFALVYSSIQDVGIVLERCSLPKSSGLSCAYFNITQGKIEIRKSTVITTHANWTRIP